MRPPALLLTRLRGARAQVGYIWGGGVILSSHDGGATWQSESPAAVVTGGLYLESIAIVPTSY